MIVKLLTFFFNLYSWKQDKGRWLIKFGIDFPLSQTSHILHFTVGLKCCVLNEVCTMERDMRACVHDCSSEGKCVFLHTKD